MPRNVYSEIFLHIIWRINDNAPQITPEIERHLHQFIRAYSEPIQFKAIGGTEDHEPKGTRPFEPKGTRPFIWRRYNFTEAATRS